MSRVIWQTTLLFTCLGVLWIVITDQLFLWLDISLTPTEVLFYQTVKGIGFVLIVGLLLFFHLKRTTKRLQKHEYAYRRLFQDSPQPSLIFDRDTYKILAVNEAACKLYGYNTAEFLKLTIKDLRPSKEVSQLVEHLKKVDKYQRHGIWNHKLKSGRVIQVEVDSQEVKFGAHNARMVLITDLTKLRESQITASYDNDQVQNSLTILHLRLDKTGKIIETNPAFLRYFPLPKDKKQFQSLQECTDENYQQSLSACLENARMSKAKKAFCTLCHNPPSSDKSLFFYWEINWLDTEQAYALIGYDVTEKHQSRKELEETNKWLRLLLRSITDGFFTLDSDFTVTYVNAEFQRLTKRNESELIGESVLNLFPRAEESGVIDKLKKVMSTKESLSYEIYSPTFKRWYRGIAYPFENGVAIFFRDITEEQKTREQLSFTEQQLHALTKSAQNRIWSVDRSLKYLYMNDAYESFFEAILGRKPKVGDHAIPPEIPRERAEHLKSFYKRGLQGETFEADYKRTIEGFGELTNRLSFNPIKNENGKVLGVGCISTDITERKKREELLQLQNELLREIALISSHDTRRPVANILGLIDRIKEKSSDSETLETSLSYLFKETAELDGVIRKIVNRVENIESNYEEMDLHDKSHQN